MDNVVDSLHIEIEASTTDVTRGLSQLKNALKKLSALTSGFSGVNRAGIESIRELTKSVRELGDAGNHSGIAQLINSLQQLSKFRSLKLPNLGGKTLSALTSGFSGVNRAGIESVRELTKSVRELGDG